MSASMQTEQQQALAEQLRPLYDWLEAHHFYECLRP
jgi:hypothetical protein